MNNDTLLIKQKNFQKIHALFFQYPVISKPRIVQLLGLSTPTVSTHITELLNQKLIQPSSSMQSQNGRPAIGYSLVPDAKVAFGVEIKFNQVRCAVVDLVGHATNIQEFPLPCSDQANYLEKFCTTIKSYIQSQAYTPEQILGIGISVQAVVNAEGSEMIYSRILPLKTLKAADLSREFALPVRLCHDVECSALSELWFDQNLSDAVYVSIAEHLGGALILNHRIEYGKVGYAGALEHLPCGTEGRKCYCGRQDCIETYCSISALLHKEERPQPSALVEVAGRLAAPWRAEDHHRAVGHKAEGRLVVVEQACARHAAQPQLRVGALAYSRRAYEGTARAAHDNTRRVDESHRTERRAVYESNHYDVVERNSRARAAGSPVGLHSAPPAVGLHPEQRPAHAERQLHAPAVGLQPHTHPPPVLHGSVERLVSIVTEPAAGQNVAEQTARTACATDHKGQKIGQAGNSRTTINVHAQAGNGQTHCFSL